jgi:basic amino acid/polyamine antiporter, APA family
MLISMISALNAYHLMASRIVFAMANDGLLIHQAARANKGGTPTLGLLFSAIASVLFISTGSFEIVVAIMAFFFVADYALAYLAVLVLRRREPDLPRPYRAWGYPGTTVIVLIGSVAFLVGAVLGDTRNSLYSLGVLALSVPLYFLTRFLRARA